MANINGKLDFVSPSTTGTTIEQIIEDDKKYGKLTPRNGKYFTYRVLNEDVEITNKQITKAIRSSYHRIEFRTNIDFKPAKPWDNPDLTIQFRTPETDIDKQLTNNTLMYHYYPINALDNKLRGVCVVNSNYYWTTDGNGRSLHEIDPKNYPNPTPYNGKTYDIDQVYAHEVLHGLGLPHSQTAGNIMSSNYTLMSEFLSDEDVSRLQAKYGVRVMNASKLKRLLAWLKRSSDR